MATTINLSSLDGNNGFRLDEPAQPSNLFGFSVSSAGDVNGDGFADVLVGVPGTSPNGNLGAGSSYVIFGKAAGFSASLELSSLNGNNGFRLDGVNRPGIAGDSIS